MSAPATAAAPATFNADLTQLPAALLPLTKERRWVGWKLEKRSTKWTKPPYQPLYYNQPAKTNDPATWGTYAQALAAFAAGHCKGIGLMLKGARLFAVDLDHIRDLATGQILGWARDLLNEAANAGCYVEWTVSGAGARIIGLSAGAELHRRITIDAATDCAIEFYRDCTRFITVSGMQNPNLPMPSELTDCSAFFDGLFARYDTAGAPPPPPASSQSGASAGAPPPPIFDFNNGSAQEPDWDDLIRNGPAPGTDRSVEFERCVWHLLRQGLQPEQIAEEFGKYPNGIAAKYAGRLAAEVGRSCSKFYATKIAVANSGGSGGPGGPGGPGSSQASGTGPAPTPGRNAPWSVIVIKPGESPRVVSEAEAAMMARGFEVYQNGDVLVEPMLVPFKACGGREYFEWQLSPMTTLNIFECFSNSATFLKYDRRAKKNVETDVSDRICKEYLDRKQKLVPRVAGIATTPFLRADGTLCDREGYDGDTGMLCKWGGTMFPPNPIGAMDRADALEALRRLEEPLAEFPFVSPADKSAALSAILTLDRKAIDAVPMHAFTAPTPGTGKGLLINVIAMIATGRPIAAINQGKDEEETEKRLGAVLIKGRGLIGIDNCEHSLGGAFLNSLITEPIVEVRVLSQSKMVSCPNSACVFADGNNLVVGADLTRRVIVCAMDAHLERPETRKFKNDRLLETVRASRERLVIAGLAILKTWHAVRPSVTVDLDPMDFVSWSERVRKALVWLGHADPGDTMQKAREDDPYRIERSTVFLEWYRVLNDRAVLVREVIAAAFGEPDLYAALLSVAMTRSGKEISPDRLGRWLARNKGMVINDLTLVRTGSTANGSPVWQIRRV
jgi:hypothetical protein